MNKTERIFKILAGLFQLLGAVIIVLLPENGLLLILLTLGLMFAFYGIKDIVRYFTMTKFMVGGRQLLIRGVIVLNFGIFSASLASASGLYISVYLIGLYAFDGVVDIMRAIESKALKSDHWRLRLIGGVVKILLGVACVVFMNSEKALAVLFAVMLIYSAAWRIASAFRRTSVIYVQ
ncbi:MAG: DUF308 domain-containing protein [Clostridia bacterium]|nr:DUF308 domain-containing protein [Clostridia bacterium]